MKKNKSTLVSIAMATYNGEKYIREQIDSILNQTHKNIELIITDDRSTDDTVKIIHEYQNNDSRIRVEVNENNLGFRENFEKVISLCNGDYISLVDQDDIWEENKLEVLINNIKDNTLIYSNSLLINGDGDTLNKTLSQKLKNNFIDSKSCLNFLYDNSVSAHSALFKKELLNFIFPFPETTYFDAFIAATASGLNGVKFLDKNLVKYRQHATNTLGNTKKNKTAVSTKVLNKVEKKQRENENILKKIQEFKKIKTITNKELNLLSKLEEFYLNFETKYFDAEMCKFLLTHSETFFTISTKNKTVLSFKKSIRKKLYKVLPFL